MSKAATSPAFDVLYNDGLPQLQRIVDAQLPTASDDQADDLLFVLKILAMYGSRGGAERVVAAAKKPLKPDAYMWHVILSNFGAEHPQRDFVFSELSDPLPPEFIAVALLDSANADAIAGDLEQHPFDSPAGTARLQQWLEDDNPVHFSYAHSATATLPFVAGPWRDQLLALAMDHVDPGVQMEAAWAAAKLGREAGLKILARFCLDVNHSDQVQRYLAELEQDDWIPAEAQDAAFQARANFAQWLAHPNELGEVPDELVEVDHRELAWPPERERKPFWIFRYLLRDDTGLAEDKIDCGLVGSMTWCFFSYRMHQRPPEDIYAIHAYWEMEHAKLITEVDVTDAAEYAGMLAQWRGGELQDATVTKVTELSPELKYPTRLVALATAQREGQPGWVVLDGPRSAWYPQAEQPEETHDGVILMIHVGRELLGFRDAPNRLKFLIFDRPRRDPQQVIAAYEQLIAKCFGASAQQHEAAENRRQLFAHGDTYVAAQMAISGQSESACKVELYQRLLKLAGEAEPSIQDEACDSFGLLGQWFDTYVDALVAGGRAAEVPPLVAFFDRHWQHNSGYGQLGGAAFRAGEHDLAERYLVKLREEYKQAFRSEEMSMLAEIWHERGESKHARALLVDCLQKLKPEILAETKYLDSRNAQIGRYKHHRATFLRLFHDGETELTRLGLPDDPLAK